MVSDRNGDVLPIFVERLSTRVLDVWLPLDMMTVKSTNPAVVSLFSCLVGKAWSHEILRVVPEY